MDIVSLLLQVRERPVRTVDFGVGYDSDTGPNAWLELRDLNLLGYGKAGRLKMMGGGEINRIEASLTDPRFFGSRVRADATTSWNYEEHKAYNLTKLSGEILFTRDITDNLTGSLKTRTEWNKLSDVIEEEIDEVSKEENTLWGTGPIIIYDTRDDFIDPTKGWLARLSIEYVMEFRRGGEFIKSEGTLSQFTTITRKVVLATSLNLGHIEPLGSSSVPLQEVFFVGGNRSVRGYTEDGLGPHNAQGDPIGGLNKIVTNVELRFPIYSFIRGVVFCDSGQLLSRGEAFDLSQQQVTVGAGLRFMTPVGPIRIDYGYKLEPVWWEKRYRWHFSFGYPF
jgi:outer membrane protein insertion porin family